MPDGIEYSERYYDESYEYRHVTLPRSMAHKINYRVMKESEWRGLGICQSPGWMHYDIHPPERHILLFKRPRGFETLPRTEQQKWTSQVNKLISEKNAKLAIKYDKNKKTREVLRTNNNQQNIPFGGGGGIDMTPPEARSPLAPISHLFY
eukprot:g9195.t1